MNKQLALLMKVYLQRQFHVYDFKAGNEKVKKRVIGMSILVILLIPFFAMYSGGLAYGLCYVGLARVIPSYAITIVALLTIVFTMLKAGSVLFDFKDYEMLTALPIKTTTIVHSRFFMMYLLNLCFSIIVMLPMGIVYAAFVKPGISFYLIWLIGTILATLIPTTIATILGAVIVAFSSRFRYSNALVTILTFFFIMAVFLSSFVLGGAEEQLNNIQTLNAIGDMAYRQMCSLYPIAALFSKAITEGDFVSLIIFVIISVLWYAMFVVILSRYFRKINSNLRGHFAKSDYQVRELKGSSKVGALYKKEWKRFIGTPIYITNVGVGVVMAVIFAVACGAVGADKILQILNMPEGKDTFTKLIPFIFTAMLGMSCTTCTSLSLEGKNLWILQSLPLSVKEIIHAKILVNLTLLLPVSCLAGGFLAIRMSGNLINGISFLLFSIVYAFFISIFGMFLNIKMPNYEWETEVTVVKQSIPSMIGMLGSAIIAITPIPFTFIVKQEQIWSVTLVAAIVFGLITFAFYTHISKIKRLPQ